MVINVLRLKDVSVLSQVPLNSEAEICIFCKPSDTVKVEDVQTLLDCGRKVRFLPAADNNEQLILLGGILDRCDRCVFLGEGFKVPSFYAEKTEVFAGNKPTAKSSSKRRSKKKTDSSEVKTDTETPVIETPVLPIPSQEVVNAPETDVPAQERVVEPASVEETSEDTPAPKEKKAKTKAGSKKKQSVNVSSLVPQEGEPEFTDDDNRALYRLLKVKSADIGYTWDTDMLMSQILRQAAKCEQADELVESVRTIRDTSILIDAVKPHANEIIEMGRKSYSR